MKVLRRTNKDADFYQLLGPFLANRAVEREIGYKIYDDPEKVWLIARELNSVQGFCYLLEKKKDSYQVGSCYVVEKYRQLGIFKTLLDKATKELSGKIQLTTKNPVLAKVLVDKGFAPGKDRGSFTEYVKEV